MRWREQPMSAGDITLRPDEARPDGGAGAGADAAPGFRRPRTAREERALPVLASPPLGGTREETAQAPSRSGIDLAIHDHLDAIGGEWRSFERDADHTVFQSFDWLANWQRHIGAAQGVVPAIVVGRGAGGETLFILPLAVETLGPLRRLTWLGSQSCDYNAPLLAGHFSARVSAKRFALAWRDVIGRLRAEARFRFDLIDLAKMPECVGEQRNPFVDLKVRAHPSRAYAAVLGHDWDTFYAAKRSPSTRKRERRQLRQLAEHGQVCFIDVEGGDERARTFATLLEQKSRVFARMGVDNPFLRPGQREFFLAMANDPAMAARIHVSRLDVGTQTAAASIGLKYRGCYYLILSSYDAGALSRFGPGRAHLHELLRHSITQRFARFDFTVGDEPYKRDWCNIELNLHDHLTAITFRGWLIGAITAEFRRIKRFIKQSPGLWRAFSKARALAGCPVRVESMPSIAGDQSGFRPV
jgi:CelD/BcsL family acetyltransferase involved in cellulose biosynthesis